MRIKLLAFIFCAFIAQFVIAQQTITGTITAIDNVPIPGVNVIIKDTSSGTATDFDGNFLIEANEGDVLIISYIGYVTKEIVVSDIVVYVIILEEDLNQLDEVLVVGYGTQKKAILTSSVSSIKGEDLAKEPVANAVQALQGKAAGVHIVASDAPGAASTVIIRGLGTIQGGRDPLYVVDGVLTGNINNEVILTFFEKIKGLQTFVLHNIKSQPCVPSTEQRYDRIRACTLFTRNKKRF